LVSRLSGKSLKLLPPDVTFNSKLNRIRFRQGPRPRHSWGSLQRSSRAEFKGPFFWGKKRKEGKGEEEGKGCRKGKKREWGEGGELRPAHFSLPSAAYASSLFPLCAAIRPW